MDADTNTGLVSVDMKKPPTPSKIRALRLEKGYTQAEAAGLLEVTARAWQHWEGGTRPINGPAWRLFQLAPVKPAAVKRAPAMTRKRATASRKG